MKRIFCLILAMLTMLALFGCASRKPVESTAKPVIYLYPESVTDVTVKLDFAGELARLGFRSATVSFESKLAQIRDLSKPLDTELLVYGRLPLMLTENCIMKNRGKGCHCHEKPQSLRDRKGEDFPVEQAWGCRNELFNAKILWLADKQADWQRTGVTYARLSFLRESSRECARIFRAYRTGEGQAPEGFTRGLYYRGVE